MRHGGVTAAPGDLDIESIGAGHDRPFGDAKSARRHARPVVQSKYHIHRKALKQPLLDHHPAATFMLFGGLEDEIHRTIEIAQLAQGFGGTQQHGRMPVVATGVHASLVCRMMREGVQFAERQGIHVGTQTDCTRAAP
jgi:hypothetical protein